MILFLMCCDIAVLLTFGLPALLCSLKVSVNYSTYNMWWTRYWTNICVSRMNCISRFISLSTLANKQLLIHNLIIILFFLVQVRKANRTGRVQDAETYSEYTLCFSIGGIIFHIALVLIVITAFLLLHLVGRVFDWHSCSCTHSIWNS